MKPSPEDMSMTTDETLTLVTCNTIRTPHYRNKYCRNPQVHTAAAPAPQPEQDAGEQWHEWKHEEHNGKHGIFEGNLLIAVVGECVARPEYAPAYAAQICADHRSAAAVPKLIQAAQNLLEYAAGLLLCLEARGVALGEGPQMQAAKTAIDEALTTVNQTGGENVG